jgi:BASS family bile acid:Na+ symporter
LQIKNLIMFAVAMAGLVVGIFLPGPSALLYPYILYLMMVILFLSFIRLELEHVTKIGPRDLADLTALTGLKLAVLPAGLWALCRLVWPEQALSVLLLSGVSTGVTAPFFAGIFRANVPRILQLTVLTSVLVPVTLPALVKLLLGGRLDISFWHMMRLLLWVIFVPLILALLGRRFTPRLIARIDRWQYPISLIMFFVINAAVFSVYSATLIKDARHVLWAAAMACVLGMIYAGAGALYGLVRGRRDDVLTGATGMGFINNVLVIVFAAKFFGDQGPLLAAMYMIPFFGLLIPLGWLARRRDMLESPVAGS